jgi:tetratricopeptide (TPR) repeat protein/tRNA A-37 threonylcarbamoyl transferase component Bud32
MDHETPLDTPRSRQEKSASAAELEARSGEELPDTTSLPTEAIRSGEVLEALLAEQRRSWRRGERVPVQAYLERYPVSDSHGESAAALVYQEFVLRQELGDSVSFAEYLREFPEYASDLQFLRAADDLVRQTLPLPEPAAASLGHCGNYLLLQEIARGGMGVVYKARQVGLNRLVALKMIRPGRFATADDLERFRHEAEAVAQLHHPHIVAVHEVGEHDGQPYFSMDYVAGQSLAAVVRENPLPAAQAAGYVQTIAEAVHYAHQHGIVHRDLKPANVLVDEARQPRITDFGLAKRIEAEAHLTLTGQVLGTPSYMPPEQAAGKLDQIGHRSDVYALGATLYELLTARPPFRADTLLETLRQVREAEPASPRSLNGHVPRNLETICLKCLEKEPVKRYGSAQDLANELKRFLKGEPIRARPAGPAERLWRWCRRNPVLAILIAAVVLSLLAGTAISLYFAVQANYRTREVERQRDEVAKQKGRAEETLRLARRAVDDFSMRFGQDKRLQAHDLEGLRKEYLQSAAQIYQQLVELHSDDPAVQTEQGRGLERLAKITLDIGSPSEAVRLLLQAQDIFAQLAQADPSNLDHQVHLANGYQHLEIVYRVMSQMDKAESASQEAIRLWENLTHNYPDNQSYQAVLAQCHFNHGTLCSETGRPTDADEAYRKALVIDERLAHANPDDLGCQADLATACNGLGAHYCDRDRRQEAHDFYQKALEIRERLAGADPANPQYQGDLATSYYNLASLYAATTRWNDAKSAYYKAAGLQERLARDHPSVIDYQVALGITRNNLGTLYLNTNQWDLAEQTCRDALSIWDNLVAGPSAARHTFSLGESACNLGEALRGKGNFEGSLDSYTKSIQAFQAVLQRPHHDPMAQPYLGNAHAGRAMSLNRLGRYAEALKDFDRALELATGLAQDHFRLLRAGTLAQLGGYTQAVTETQSLTAKSKSADLLFRAACVYSLSSAAAQKDASLPSAERGQLAEQYAARAIELLRDVQAAQGFSDPASIANLRKEKDLDSVRSRKDFKALIDEVAVQTKSGAP